MRTKNLDLLLAITIALLNIFWTWRLGTSKLVGLVLALPQVFLLPGYTFVEVLFHRRPVEAVRRLTLSFGLSLATDILSGLVINIFPVGLSRVSWTFYLTTWTIVFSLAGLLLRGKTSTNGIWLSQIRLDVRKHLVGEIFLVVAVVITISSLLLSNYSALHQHHKGFTQLWMIQADQARKSCTVLIGVDNFEFTTMKYHLVMTVNDTQSTLLPPISLHPQKTWKIIVPINAFLKDDEGNKGDKGDANVNALLYQTDKPALVYRNVHITLHNPNAKKICST